MAEGTSVLLGIPVSFWAALIGAGLGGYVALSGVHRRIRLEGVTQERQKWRATIRCLADKLYERDPMPDFERVASEFALNLNPFDSEDKAIVELIRRLATGDVSEGRRREAIERVGILLKHDWERSKRETSWWPWRLIPVPRIRYSEIMELR